MSHFGKNFPRVNLKHWFFFPGSISSISCVNDTHLFLNDDTLFSCLTWRLWLNNWTNIILGGLLEFYSIFAKGRNSLWPFKFLTKGKVQTLSISCSWTCTQYCSTQMKWMIIGKRHFIQIHVYLFNLHNSCFFFIFISIFDDTWRLVWYEFMGLLSSKASL